MNIDPKTIHFETTDDLVDYILKGVPPSNENLQSILDHIKGDIEDPFINMDDDLKFEDRIPNDIAAEILESVHNTAVSNFIITGALGLVSTTCAYKIGKMRGLKKK